MATLLQLMVDNWSTALDEYEQEYLAENPWKLTKQRPIDWLDDNFPRFMRSLDEIFDTSAPYALNSGPNESGIYFLIYEDEIAETLAYVGLSICIPMRLNQHYKNKPFTHFNYICGIPTMFLAAVESYYIHRFQPPLNAKIEHLHEIAAKHLSMIGEVCDAA